jgi:hypothetical protein
VIVELVGRPHDGATENQVDDLIHPFLLMPVTNGDDARYEPRPCVWCKKPHPDERTVIKYDYRPSREVPA